MFVFLILFFTFFLIAEYGQWNPFLVIATLLSGAGTWISLQVSLRSTGVWKLCKSKAENLDEREMTVVLNSFRRSYLIFGVVSLVLVLFIVMSVRFSWITLTQRGHFSFGLAIVMFLDFLVAILPSSIVAWTEPVFENE